MFVRPFAALLLAALALPAAAHTPYLAPASSEVRPDSVVTLPDGSTTAPDTVHLPMYGNNYTLSFRVLEP